MPVLLQDAEVRLSWHLDEVQKAQQQAAQLQVGWPCPSVPVWPSMPVSMAALPRRCKPWSSESST